MNSSYTLVNYEQGTTEWLAWRSNGIGASDAPAIMGENPWKSSAQLLLEKLDSAQKPAGNAAMAMGTKLEPEARRLYEEIYRIPVIPACLQSNKNEWLRASVDGLASDGSVVVEIKCGESVYAKTVRSRQVPRHYFGQLQHILAVTDFPHIDFFCWLPNRPEVLIRVDRDDRYIERLIWAEQEFWLKLVARRGAR